MNRQTQQKFMTIFNDMLSDRSVSALGNVLQINNSGDEIDKLTQNQEEKLSMRLDERNILFLKKVKEAKQKILDGSYGECEECGDEIAQKRLLARPTATFCIHCQEEKEKSDFSKFKNRRDLKNKSIGEDNVGEHISKREKYGSINDIAFESVVDL